MGRRPVVGVAGFVKTISVAPGMREPGLVAPLRYVDAVSMAGGDPVLLPYGSRVAVDAVLLIGGVDVGPSTYGRDADPRTEGVDAARDSSELDAVRRAIDGGLPTLAICRGSQILNVALGGTLVQHIEGHRGPEGGVVHDVRAAPGSRVADACGTSFAAWSGHHQAMETLGDGLRATAWAPDGTLEAAELESGFVVAVQWHPERTAAEDPSQLALFEALVRACGA